MRKIYRRSQKHKIIGHWISGFDMHRYGLPYTNAGGSIFPREVDLVERLIDAAKSHPDVHIVTRLRNGWSVNRYQAENALAHNLYTGNPDPDIEFNEDFSVEDLTAEEIAAFERREAEYQNRAYSPRQVAAVNYLLNKILDGDKEN